MKLADAQLIIANNKEPRLLGYVVSYYWEWGEILGVMRPQATIVTGEFPDIAAGEKPFASREIAQEYADGFAANLGEQVSHVRVRPLYFSATKGFTRNGGLL